MAMLSLLAQWFGRREDESTVFLCRMPEDKVLDRAAYNSTRAWTIAASLAGLEDR